MTTRPAWLIVALLCVFMFINFADRALLGLAGTQIADELGLSPFMYGVVASSFYLLFSVSAIAGGFLATRVDAGRIVFVLALVWTVAQLSAGLLPGLAVLVASRILLGIGQGPACRTGTWRSCWSSAVSRSTTSPSTGGCSGSPRYWPMRPGSAGTRPATGGSSTRPKSRSTESGGTSIGPSTSTGRSSMCWSRSVATRMRPAGSSSGR
jgi:MFS family permease